MHLYLERWKRVSRGMTSQKLLKYLSPKLGFKRSSISSWSLAEQVNQLRIETKMALSSISSSLSSGSDIEEN